MNLVVTVLLDRMPRTSSFSFHVDIFDTFRGHGEAVLVHLATEEVRFACGGGVVKGLSSDDYFHELLSRLVLGRKQGAHGAYVSVGGRGHFVGGDAVDVGGSLALRFHC